MEYYKGYNVDLKQLPIFTLELFKEVWEKIPQKIWLITKYSSMKKSVKWLFSNRLKNPQLKTKLHMSVHMYFWYLERVYKVLYYRCTDTFIM